MYKVELAKSLKKDFKKITNEVKNLIFERWIPNLQQDPHIGERMKGPIMKKFWKLAFRYKKNDYRIVYEIKESKILIVVIAVGSRENFYKRFKGN